MFPWLSGFLLNPAMAIGAGAIASPILIHILSRRRFRRLRWAAMAFLLEAQRRNRRRVRLEQLILLFLRCLAVFLIAAVMMRPFLRPGALMAILGAAPRTERILLLDDSYSMSYHPAAGPAGTGDSTFARARQAVEQIARWIADESPADSLTLLLTSDPRRSALSLPSLTERNLRRLQDRLAALRPSQTVARIADALAALADLTAGAPTQANTAVYVISDFQKRDWILPDDPTVEAPRSVVDPLAALRAAGQSLKLVLVNVGDPAAENVAITGLVSAQPQSVAGVPARFEVAISSFRDRPLKDVELTIAVAEHRLPPVVIPRIPPRQTVREPIEITFPRDGSDYLQVALAGAALNDDTLRLDNTRTLAVHVVPAVQILLVDGEASNDRYRDEVFLLRTALRPEGRAASGNELTIIDEQELEDSELADYHAVILANVGRLSEPARRSVEAFVRDGGGLIIFGGDQVDIDYYNDRLYREGEGFLPLPLREVAEPPPGTGALTFADWDAAHPMMRAFVGDLVGLLRQVRIHAFLATGQPPIDRRDEPPRSPPDPAAGSPAATTSPATGDAPDAPSPRRAPARVVVRFSDPRSSPAIVQRRFGRGLCVFIATSADQEWNDWAANFSYLPLMLELVQYAARHATVAGQAVVGAPILCPLEAGSLETRARLRTPDYPVVPELALEATAAPGGEPLLTFNDTSKVGIYRFLLAATTGEPISRFAAVNPDPAESNLASVTRAELASELAEDMPFEYVEELSVLAAQSAGARQELWWPLLLAAIGVLMLEHGLAWFFGTRG